LEVIIVRVGVESGFYSYR